MDPKTESTLVTVDYNERKGDKDQKIEKQDNLDSHNVEIEQHTGTTHVSGPTEQKSYVTDENARIEFKDSKECIHIHIPEKYKEENYIPNEKENYIINFYNNINIIREQKLTLRDITLNKILLLKFKIRENGMFSIVKLYLNMGLNPYLYFNDYYIHSLNIYYRTRPLLIFRRFKHFNPLDDTILNIKPVANMSVRHEDLYEHYKSLKDKKISALVWLEPDHPDVVCMREFKNPEKKIWWVQNLTIDLHPEEKINIEIETNKISNLKHFVDKKMITENDAYRLFNTDKMMYIWKYGTDIYNPYNIEFEWLDDKFLEKWHHYDLVNSYSNSKIRKSDFFNYYNIDGIEIIINDEETKREILELIGYEDIINKMRSRLKTIGTTSLCNDNNATRDNDNEGNSYLMITCPLRNIIVNYIISIQDYIFEGKYEGIKKYIKNSKIPETIMDEDLYKKLLNENLYLILEEGLENYSNEVISNEDYELQTPDIYILLGFHKFPCFFSKELWASEEFSGTKKWYYIIKSLNFLESREWYYMYGLCCFFAQVIGPSYYIYDYYIISNNEYCPNQSNILNKFFAVAYYLVLYARMNSFWRSLTTTVWQYGNTTILKSDNYLRLTLVVNSICLYIVPLFTYTLFIELSNVTDLILNCLTGEFLINIDNLIIEFIGEESYIKTLTKDLLIFSYLEKGYPKKNIMEGNTTELWVTTLIQVIQMFGTLIMTAFVYRCI
jgi:hypothetical protein